MNPKEVISGIGIVFAYLLCAYLWLGIVMKASAFFFNGFTAFLMGAFGVVVLVAATILGITFTVHLIEDADEKPTDLIRAFIQEMRK